MVRKDIIDDLKARFGDRCYKCGAEGVPLYLHHIVLLNEGGNYSLENIRLYCSKCHSGAHMHACMQMARNCNRMQSCEFFY